jgi:hypothetical protein
VGFASLQHMLGEKVHVTRALPTRYVPPPGFDYPLDGFLPFRPDRFCFTPAALLGFTLRSFLLAKGNRTVSGPDAPTYRWPKARKHPKVLTGPRRRFLGFDPFASPWRNQALLTPSSLDAPLGFGPSRVRRHQPRPGFRPDSSFALGRRTGVAPNIACAIEFRSACAGLPATSRHELVQAKARGSGRQGRKSDPPRVFAPVRSQAFEPGNMLGMSSPHAAPRIAA